MLTKFSLDLVFSCLLIKKKKVHHCQSYPVWNNVSSGSTVCSDRTSVATPPCWSKAEGTVNSLDGKLLLHVEHCLIQSLAALANLWNHRLSDFQSFLLHMWASEASPSNTPPLWRKWSEPGHTVPKHWNHQAQVIQCACLADRDYNYKLSLESCWVMIHDLK